MRILDLEQGSDEWLQARCGLPTCSQADRILTPAKLKLSSSAGMYRNQLLTEWLLGHSVDWTGQNDWMDRGRQMEAEARAWIEFDRGITINTVGLILSDDGAWGGSPDGLVGDDMGVEIKCPSLHMHIGNLCEPDGFVAAYRGQVQSLMALTGRDRWLLCSYNPDPRVPPLCVEVERDEAYCEAWGRVLAQFLSWLAEGKEKLSAFSMEVVS